MLNDIWLFYIIGVFITLTAMYINSYSTLENNNLKKVNPSSFYKYNNKRNYSTSTSPNFLDSLPYTFPMEDVKTIKNLKGVSGVYMIINNHQSSSFYIGSSINLQRRLITYCETIKGQRKGTSSFEKGLYLDSIKNWSIIVLAIVPKDLVLVEEQLAICTFRPTLNVNYKVVINYWHPGFNASEALNLALKYQKLFLVDSKDYLRFDRLIRSLNNLVSFKNVQSYISDGNLGKPVFVYDFNTKNLVAIYSSINLAQKRLGIANDTLIKLCTEQILYTRSSGQKLAFSFLALTRNEIDYYINIRKTNQIVFRLNLKDKDGHIVSTYNSLREFCKIHTEFSLRTLRRRLADGMMIYNNYTIEIIKENRRKTIYCYDPDTQLRVGVFLSTRRAIKVLKMNFYTLKTIVESNGIHKGVLYSYFENYPK